MREEHPLQQELAVLPTHGSDQVREMSEVAKLQSDALPLGLVREARPVFVYDSKLAKEKTSNAQRQAKHRVLRESKGLMIAEVPREIFELVKVVHGGNWLEFSRVLASGVPPEPPFFGEKGKLDVKVPEFAEVPQITTHSITTTESIKKEITTDGGIESWLQKKINSAIDSLPKPAPALSKIIEKVIEKPVIKLTSEQKISLRIGEKVQRITGWRAFIARKLLNI